MASKTKPPRKTGTYTVNLGDVLPEKVEDYRAMKRLKGTRIRTMDEALRSLVVSGLIAEGIPA